MYSAEKSPASLCIGLNFPGICASLSLFWPLFTVSVVSKALVKWVLQSHSLSGPLQPTLSLCHNCALLSLTLPSHAAFQDVCAGPRMYHSLVNQANLEQHTPKGKYTERKPDVARNGARTLKVAYTERAGNWAGDPRLVLCFHSPVSARSGAELRECLMKSVSRVSDWVVKPCSLFSWIYLPRVQGRWHCCLGAFGPEFALNLHTSLRVEPAMPLPCENGTCL